VSSTKGLFKASTQAAFAVTLALAGQLANAATAITIKAGNALITATLDDSPTSRDFVKSLPLTIGMKRWGEREYYGRLREPLSDQGRKQSGFANGDVAYWPHGGSFAIFFNNKVNPDISDLIVFGKISSDLKAFDAMDESLDMRIELAK
jgi:hypothetical protein